MFEIFEILGI